MTAVEVLFCLLGVMAVGSAVLVALSSHVVHCALWLVVTLGALAGLYLLLAAEFVAWVQVLIYVGAVVATATAAVLVTTFSVGFRDASLDIGTQDVGTASSLGTRLFDSWVVPFEILSVLLLAALVGAIVISRHRESR